MKLLIVSQYFWPEPFIINDLAIELAGKVDAITVLTGKPNYPDGKIYDGFTTDQLHCERFNGIEVIRVPLKPRGKSGSVDLVRNYFSFLWSGLWYFPRMIKQHDIDVILVFAPSPITSAIPAILLKWLKKAHLAVWVQDLWPESLSATGHITNPLMLSLVRVLVKIIYRCTDTLLIPSRAFHEPVAGMAAKKKIIYYPNSVRLPSQGQSETLPLPPMLTRLLESKFCIVFAGNLGKAQAIETLVGAARLLKHMPDIQLVFVGSGSMLDWIVQQKTIHMLDNVHAVGRYPVDLMPQIFAGASALLVALKKRQILSYTIPSKIQAYLAAGKPIIAALDGEGARIIKEAKAGVCSEAENATALAQCIQTVYHMSAEERKRMGENGYAYFMEHFEMRKQAAHLVDILLHQLKAAEKKMA